MRLGKVWIFLALDLVPTPYFSFSFPDLCAEANPTHLQELRSLLPAKSPAVPPASSTTQPTPKEREHLGLLDLSVIKKRTQTLGFACMETLHLHYISRMISESHFPHKEQWQNLKARNLEHPSLPQLSAAVLYTHANSISPWKTHGLSCWFRVFQEVFPTILSFDGTSGTHHHREDWVMLFRFKITR